METRGDAEQPKLTCSVDVLPGRIMAGPERAMRGIDGSSRRRGTAEAHLHCGRAPRTRQCAPDGIGRLGGAAAFTAQPKRVFLPPHARVHRETRPQGWSEFLELFHFSEHLF